MLFKRKNSPYWWITFTTANGERIRQSTRTSDKKKAQELADKLKAESWNQVQLNHKPQFIWQEAVVRWLQETTKRSVDTDKYMLNWLRPYLDNKHLVDIDKNVIEHIIRAKLDEGCSQTRVNRVTTLICSILNKARKEWGWIDVVPQIRKFPEPSKRIRWLTREEAYRLLHELPSHLKAMARFSLATGLRESNVTLLEWNQIDLQRKVCWIHPDQAKMGKAIGVPLNQSAISVLTQQIGNHTIRVFTYKGSPVLKASTRAWRNCLKRVGIENFRWHDLRHTWASWHVQAGTPLHVLQELGGWASFQMVQKYAHLAPEHLANYADSLDDNWHNSDTLENVIPIKKNMMPFGQKKQEPRAVYSPNK